MIQIMSTRPPSVLFPRLLSLKIDSYSGPQFGPIVMHHSISALTITFSSPHSPPQMNFEELALHVSERMPNLTTLDLDIPAVEARMQEGLLHFLENLPRLQEVTLSPTMFSSSIIEPLAALNSLRVLSSSIPDNDGWVDCPDSFYVPLEEGAFPSLQSISFGASLSEARRLLEEPHFPASYMTSIILNVPCPLRETPSRLREILQSLADSFHSLQRLEFSMVDIHTEELAQPLPVFDFTDISPVLRLRHLKALTIRYLRPITITDDQLESLSASLPQLEELVLTAYPMFTPKPTLTLPSIISFAVHCPNMKKLALYLRTSGIALLPSADARFNHLAHLWVGYSDASGDIEKICRFLYPLLPRKCEIMATVDECCEECNYIRNPTRWETEDEEDRVKATDLWRGVERTIGLMNHAREDAEKAFKSEKKTLQEELRVARARLELESRSRP